MSAHVPISDRIVADLDVQIRSGQLNPGDALPSITKLGETYRCSETPVKAALRTLRDKGLIEGHPGKATYVVQNLPPGYR